VTLPEKLPTPPARGPLPSWLNANGTPGITAQTPVAAPAPLPIQKVEPLPEPPSAPVESDKAEFITAEIIEIVPANLAPVEAVVESSAKKPVEALLEPRADTCFEILDESAIAKANSVEIVEPARNEIEVVSTKATEPVAIESPAPVASEFPVEAQSAPIEIPPWFKPVDLAVPKPPTPLPAVPVPYEIWVRRVSPVAETAPEVKSQSLEPVATEPTIPTSGNTGVVEASPVIVPEPDPEPAVIPVANERMEAQREMIATHSAPADEAVEILSNEVAAVAPELQPVNQFEVLDDAAIAEADLVEIVDPTRDEIEALSMDLIVAAIESPSSPVETPPWLEPLRLVVPEPPEAIPPAPDVCEAKVVSALPEVEVRPDPEPVPKLPEPVAIAPAMPLPAFLGVVADPAVDAAPVMTPVAAPAAREPIVASPVRATTSPSSQSQPPQQLASPRMMPSPVMPKFPLRPPRASAKAVAPAPGTVKTRPTPPPSPLFAGRSIPTIPLPTHPPVKVPPLFGANPLDRYFSTKTPPPVNWGAAGTLLGISGEVTVTGICDAISELPGITGCVLVAAPYLAVCGDWPDAMDADNSLTFARRLTGLLKRGNSGLSQRQITTESGTVYAFALDDVLVCAISAGGEVTSGICERLSVVTKAITYARKAALKRSEAQAET
jgi:hypothetical protein